MPTKKSPAQLQREIDESLAYLDKKYAKERSEYPHIQVGVHVELPARSPYRDEGDTHGDVVKIRGNAAYVRMDSGRVDWFKLADLRVSRKAHPTDDDGGSGVQFGSAGTKVSIEPTPRARRRGGKGLIHKTRKYGVLMEDARIGPGGGWDVYDVRLPDGSETSAYGFDLRLAPSAIFREAIGEAQKKRRGR